MVFWDQRSHGRSGRSDLTHATIDQLGDDLLAVLEATTAPGRPVVLVGHSMGGMTIMALADRHPELFGDRVVGVALRQHLLGRAGRADARRCRWRSARSSAPRLPGRRPRHRHGRAGSSTGAAGSAPTSRSSSPAGSRSRTRT